MMLTHKINGGGFGWRQIGKVWYRWSFLREMNSDENNITWALLGMTMGEVDAPAADFRCPWGL
jgi:hypothetical protein